MKFSVIFVIFAIALANQFIVSSSMYWPGMFEYIQEAYKRARLAQNNSTQQRKTQQSHQ